MNWPNFLKVEPVSPRCGSSARNPRIDVLRGVSILVVLLLHFTLSYRLGASPLAAIVGPKLLRALLINGNYGVTMFFTISGYLITSMSLARFGSPAGVRLRPFYAYRSARILPCLTLALAIISGLALLGWPSFANSSADETVRIPGLAVTLLSVLTFWHNVLMDMKGYFNYALNIYWSLSVEEVFYLAFPLAFAFLRRRRWILLLCAAAMVAGPIYRALNPDNEIRYMYGYLACFDAISMGCAAALLAGRLSLRGPWGKGIQALALLLVSVTYLRGIDGHETFGFTLISLGTAVLLLGSETGSTERIASSPVLGWLRWLGRHSYELYLFHIIVLGIMRELLHPAGLPGGWKPALLLAFLAISSLVAALVARFFSEPLNRKLRRILAGPLPL